MTPIIRCALFCLALLVIGFAPTGKNAADPVGCDTTSDMMLVSVKTGGEPVTDLGSGHAISDDARYIVFESRDSTIIPGDTNNTYDFFLHDRETCTTTLISRNPSGVPGTGSGKWSSQAFISGDGRYVLFDSQHIDLVPDDNTGNRDVFLYDGQTQLVTRISNGMNGEEANGESAASGISSNGRFILFSSYADNLVPDDTNAQIDSFLFDRTLSVIELITIDNDGVAGDGWSAALDVSDDGRFVVFVSTATNLSPLETTSRQKVFLRDRLEGTTTLVSVNSAGEPASGGEYDLGANYTFLSDDTRYIGMLTDATNFDPNDTNEGQDSYLYDRLTGEVTWVTPRIGDTIYYAHAWDMSSDNRFVVIESASPMDGIDINDVPDIFLYDRQTGLMMLQSRTPSGTASNGFSFFPRLTPDAKYIVFQSSATNMLLGVPEAESNLYLSRIVLPSGSLDVTTTLQGRPPAPHPDWVTSVRVVIVPEGSTTPVYDAVLETDENGTFTIPDLTYGIYTVWVKGANSLATSQTITLAADSLNVNTGMLRAGDANGDNVINLVDFSLLAATFGMQDGEPGYDTQADFNGDDLITLPDFSLLASNFNTAGDPLPD